jgi:hypothetical protein
MRYTCPGMQFRFDSIRQERVPAPCAEKQDQILPDHYLQERPIACARSKSYSQTTSLLFAKGCGCVLAGSRT